VRTTTTWVVVVGWGVFYVVALAHADPLPTLDTAVMWLVVPPLLWVLAVRLVLRHRWSETGSHMSAMDVPGGVLAAAVAALPERRRDWGGAMTAELAGIQGRSARWRFALSSARAALRLPPLGGWPGLALGTGVVVAAAAGAAVHLAAVLAGCLWIAVASPRWLGTSRLAPHLGAAAVVFAAWFLLSNRTDGTQPPPLLVLGLAAALVVTPIAVFIVPAFVAGRAGRSLGSGLQAAVWTVAAIMPLTYAVWLPEGLRRHAIDRRLLDGEVVAPVGANLPEALVFCLGIFPVVGLTLGVIGAALGARRAIPND
jgi:hypothetical protein